MLFRSSLLGSTGTSAPLSKRADNRPPYADILRGEHRGAMHNPTSLLYTSCERSIVHIHGVVDEPDTIVLSREVSQRHTITCHMVNYYSSVGLRGVVGGWDGGHSPFAAPPRCYVYARFNRRS